MLWDQKKLNVSVGRAIRNVQTAFFAFGGLSRFVHLQTPLLLCVMVVEVHEKGLGSRSQEAQAEVAPAGRSDN